MWYSVVTSQQCRTDTISASVTSSQDSPWFSGHFPDDPILPGIAQLHMVTDLISAMRQERLYLATVHRVKFRKIVRPGEVLDIQATPGNKEHQYTFTIMSGDQDVCSGMILLKPSLTAAESP